VWGGPGSIWRLPTVHTLYHCLLPGSLLGLEEEGVLHWRGEGSCYRCLPVLPTCLERRRRRREEGAPYMPSSATLLLFYMPLMFAEGKERDMVVLLILPVCCSTVTTAHYPIADYLPDLQREEGRKDTPHTAPPCPYT